MAHKEVGPPAVNTSQHDRLSVDNDYRAAPGSAGDAGTSFTLYGTGSDPDFSGRRGASQVTTPLCAVDEHAHGLKLATELCSKIVVHNRD